QSSLGRAVQCHRGVEGGVHRASFDRAGRAASPAEAVRRGEEPGRRAGVRETLEWNSGVRARLSPRPRLCPPGPAGNRSIHDYRELEGHLMSRYRWLFSRMVRALGLRGVIGLGCLAAGALAYQLILVPISAEFGKATEEAQALQKQARGKAG